MCEKDEPCENCTCHKVVKLITMANPDKKGFTDQKPRFATEKNLTGNWNGAGPGVEFRCGFCGYKFKLHDYWRWFYTNNIPDAGGNPLICEKCDSDSGDTLIARWKLKHEEANGRMWWFSRHKG